MTDEFLDCSGMVEHSYRVKLGLQALGAWLRNCLGWRGEWQILSTVVAVFGGICVNVWG